MKYRSKIGVIWIISMIAMIWLNIPLIEKAASNTTVFIVLLIMIPCDLYMLDLTFRTYYILEKDHLFIRCGIGKPLKIPYKDIHTLKETHNPLASSALSLDRIDLVFKAQNGGNGEDEILISPVRKQEFIQQLLLKANHIKVLNNL